MLDLIHCLFVYLTCEHVDVKLQENVLVPLILLLNFSVTVSVPVFFNVSSKRNLCSNFDYYTVYSVVYGMSTF